MLPIRRCLFGSSKGGKHDKHKYNDIPSIPKEGFHLNISTNPLHAPKKAHSQPKPALEDGDELQIEPQPDKTVVEETQHDETIVEEARHDETIVEEARHDETLVKEAQHDETLVEEAPREKIIVEEPPDDESIQEEALLDKTIVEEAQPDETIEELAPLYKLLLEEPQESKLNQIFRDLIGPYKCPEELGDVSINLGLYEPDYSSLYMHTEILGSESSDNMVKDMSEAVTEWSWSHKGHKMKAIDIQTLANRGLPPPIPRYVGRPCCFMKVERCNGRITMNEVMMDRQPEKMQIERDVGEIKIQLMTYVGDAEASTSTLYVGDAWNDDAEASTSRFYYGDALNDDAEASTSALYLGNARKDNVDTYTLAMNFRDAQASISALCVGDAGDDDVEAIRAAMYAEDAKNGDIEASSSMYVGDARCDDAEASTSRSTLKQASEASEETTQDEEVEEEEEATDELDSRGKGKQEAAKAA